MERVRFSYEFSDADNDKQVLNSINDDGLSCSRVCEAFVDFMTSAGYTEENIVDYFNK